MRAETLSQYIVRVTGEQGLSIREITERAQSAGVRLSNSAVFDMANGRLCNPSVQTVSALAVGLGVPVEEIAAASGLPLPLSTNPSVYERTVAPAVICPTDPTPLTDNERKFIDAEIRFHLLMEQPNTPETAAEIDRALYESHEALEGIIAERGLRSPNSESDDILDADHLE